MNTARKVTGRLPDGGSFVAVIQITGHQPNHPGGYFSLTGDRYGPDRTLTSSGAIGDDVAAGGRPDLVLANAMHLADAITGEPMHAIANAVYFRRTGELEHAASTLRVPVWVVERLSPVALRYFAERQRPRWAREAEEMREIIARPDDTADYLTPAELDEDDEPPEVVDFPHDDVISSQDLIRVMRSDDETFSPEVTEEIEDAAGYAPDWEHGETLISADHFETYARQLAEDIGALPDDAGWPASFIDWPAAADALKADYTEVTIDGVDYYLR